MLLYNQSFLIQLEENENKKGVKLCNVTLFDVLIARADSKWLSKMK